MNRIFISYRRSDTEPDAGRLYSDLALEFGAGQLFKDVDDVPLGANVRSYIGNAISESAVVLALIGPDWEPDRLHQEMDWVRIELEAAFELGVAVLPIRFRRAEIPPPSALPESIQSLSELNAGEIEHRSWGRDLAPIVESVRRIVAQVEAERTAAEKAEADRLAQIEAERAAQVEAERTAAEKAEADRLAQIEAERAAQVEAERTAAEKAEADRLAQIEAERAAQVEAERTAAEKAEADRLAQIEANDTYTAETAQESATEFVRKRAGPIQKVYEGWPSLGLGSIRGGAGLLFGGGVLAVAAIAIVIMATALTNGTDPSSQDEQDQTSATGDAEGSTSSTTAQEPAGASVAPAGSGGELLLLQWQAPSQANALLSGATKDALAASLVIEPLAKFDPNGQIVPTLVSEIPTVDNGGVAPDFSSITWNLRDDITWSDGTPFTSDDVLFTYEYCSDEATGCFVDYFTVESVVAEDDFTVTVAFTEPQPFPYQHFVGYLAPIIQRDQFAECIGAAALDCSDENLAPVGTGPYMVTEFRPEDTVTYEMNPNYRGVTDGKPSFGNVTIQGGGDAEAAARSVLEIGEADYGWNLQVAPETLESIEAAGTGRIVTSFTANVEHINLNQTDPRSDPPSEGTPHPILADNPELARALSLAIDRDALVQAGYGPTGVPTCVMWPVGDQESTNQDWCLTRDVDEANSILDDLGYADNDGDGVRETSDGQKLEFDYLTSTNAVRQRNQDIIKANWEEIGVVANMGNEDASLFFDGTCASDACIWKFFTDMEMFTNGSTLPDPVNYLRNWTSQEIPISGNSWVGSNMPRQNSPEYDDLWSQASTMSSSDPAYIELVRSMQDLLVENGIVIPLIHRGNVSAISLTILGLGEPNGWDSEYWNIEEWRRRSL